VNIENAWDGEVVTAAPSRWRRRGTRAQCWLTSRQTWRENNHHGAWELLYADDLILTATSQWRTYNCQL